MISEQQKPTDSGFGAKAEPSEIMEGWRLRIPPSPPDFLLSSSDS